MVFSFLYLVVRALFGALVRSRRGLHVKDIELLVLREGCINSVGRADLADLQGDPVCEPYALSSLSPLRGADLVSRTAA